MLDWFLRPLALGLLRRFTIGIYRLLPSVAPLSGISRFFDTRTGKIRRRRGLRPGGCFLFFLFVVPVEDTVTHLSTPELIRNDDSFGWRFQFVSDPTPQQTAGKQGGKRVVKKDHRSNQPESILRPKLPL